MSGDEDIVVAGRGASDRPHPELIDAGARATIRYADPAAWTVAAAVARATAPLAGILGPWRDEVGIAVVSDQGPAATMEQVQVAAEAGFSSPLRYVAASPGSLAGVSCIAFGFRGPTLNLTMPPSEGIPILLLMARAWLDGGTARAMVIAAHVATERTGMSARAVLLGPRALMGAGEGWGAASAWLKQLAKETG